MQLIHEYFTCQLVQISPFTNILPLPNFPMYNFMVHFRQFMFVLVYLKVCYVIVVIIMSILQVVFQLQSQVTRFLEKTSISFVWIPTAIRNACI